MKLHLTLPIVATLLALTSTAHAGKAEREYAESTMNPAVKAAAAAYKSACTGDLKIDVKADTFQTVDEMRQVSGFVNQITSSAASYCKDSGTKKVMAKLKVLEISKSKQVTVKFSGDKAVATTDESSYPSWDMLAREVDK
jgi:hypothetical protein